MKKLAAALLVLSSCASAGRESEASDAFWAWAQAMVEGDADVAIGRMTPAWRSEWLYGLLRQRDPSATLWRERLSGTARTDLDLWIYTNDNRKSDERVISLPVTVGTHPSLHELFVKILSEDRAGSEARFTGMEVKRVVVEGRGATIAVSSRNRPTEYFAMIWDGTGWQVDGHVQPRSTLQR